MLLKISNTVYISKHYIRIRNFAFMDTIYFLYNGDQEG